MRNMIDETAGNRWVEKRKKGVSEINNTATLQLQPTKRKCGVVFEVYFVWKLPTKHFSSRTSSMFGEHQHTLVISRLCYCYYCDESFESCSSVNRLMEIWSCSCQSSSGWLSTAKNITQHCKALSLYSVCSSCKGHSTLGAFLLAIREQSKDGCKQTVVDLQTPTLSIQISCL